MRCRKRVLELKKGSFIFFGVGKQTLDSVNVPQDLMSACDGCHRLQAEPVLAEI